MPPPDPIQKAVDGLCCAYCGTKQGNGFAILPTQDEGNGAWLAQGRCVKCGKLTRIRLRPQRAPEYDEPDVQEALAKTHIRDREISADEVLAVHEALEDDGWFARIAKAGT